MRAALFALLLALAPPAAAASLPEGGATELTLAIGSGRLEVAVTRGRGLPFWDRPRLQLRRGATVVRTATGAPSLFAAAVAGPQAVFDADAGVYTLRVPLPGGPQFVDIPGLRITAGETNRQAVEAGAAELLVEWSRSGELNHGARPFPTVRILHGGRLLVTRSADPARFVLLPGTYEMVVFLGSRELLRRNLTLAAGDTERIEVGP